MTQTEQRILEQALLIVQKKTVPAKKKEPSVRERIDYYKSLIL